MSQIEIIFSVHDRESNSFSQAILDANREVFISQCQILFNAFYSGARITSHSSITEYKIVDFRARVAELRKNKVSLSWVPSTNGRSKEWFMSAEDKVNNKQFTQ
jgi:hypothetical protein